LLQLMIFHRPVAAASSIAPVISPDSVTNP
jgi:hypothetical protein